jgi:hypothetical protein
MQPGPVGLLSVRPAHPSGPPRLAVKSAASNTPKTSAFVLHVGLCVFAWIFSFSSCGPCLTDYSYLRGSAAQPLAGASVPVLFSGLLPSSSWVDSYGLWSPSFSRCSLFSERSE